MGRANNVASISYQAMDWSNDALTITYSRSKSDPGGVHSGNEKHLYANIFQPDICPILAIAIWVFSSSKQGDFLFPGTFEEDRYRCSLKKLLNSCPDIAQFLGVNPNDIGSHSNRKGSVSFVLMYVGKFLIMYTLTKYSPL